MEKSTDCSIDDLFEKKFCFEKSKDWKLPSSFLEENALWNVDSLNVLKQDLNSTKSLLNDKGEDWHDHTDLINKAAYVINFIKTRIQPEILTKAWCKFYEILSSFTILNEYKDKVRSLHLCEAPGAFISALNYYLCVNNPYTDWKWIANTLNPYYEGHNIRNVVVDDRLLFPTLRNWYFGQDMTGDITDPNYIDDICQLVSDEVGLFDMVTADGSFDCLDNPGEQELIVAKLHYAEVLIALSCLSPGGCFILKMFTSFECITICQLYLLNCVFDKVHIFKPFTSRSSNSEVYVICTGFIGSEDLSRILDHYKDVYRTRKSMTIFPKSAIPESFLQQLMECTNYFVKLQISAIKENLLLYPLKDDILKQKLEDLKETCAGKFIEKYSVYTNALYDACKLYSTKKRVKASFSDEMHKNAKSIYFQAVGGTFNDIKKSPSLLWHEKLLDVENRINVLFPINRKRPSGDIEWHFPWTEIRRKMKSKSFQNWIKTGKRIECIHNSKFCNPVHLYLWNQISIDANIEIQSLTASHCYWNLEAIAETLTEEPSTDSNLCVLGLNYCYKQDIFLQHLKEYLNFKMSDSRMDTEQEVDLHVGSKIVYINSTAWAKSLHQECVIKNHLTEVLSSALKILRKGDGLLLCIQSVLTRYVAGLMFIVLSLFDKFTVLLPEDSAPACHGQIWIFKNFQEHKWLNNVNELLTAIKQLKLSETYEVLEVVSMSSLCGGMFHVFLRNVNNKHILQRLRNLIVVEKCKVEKPMNCK